MPEKRSTPVEVVFEVEPSPVHEQTHEALAAEPVGGDRYRLASQPLYAYGYNRGDVVEALPGEGGALIARRCIERSGHATFRLIVTERGRVAGAFDAHWTPLAELGCSTRRAGETYLSVDAPPAADLAEVRRLLLRAEEAGIWFYEDAESEVAAD